MPSVHLGFILKLAFKDSFLNFTSCTNQWDQAKFYLDFNPRLNLLNRWWRSLLSGSSCQGALALWFSSFLSTVLKNKNFGVDELHCRRILFLFSFLYCLFTCLKKMSWCLWCIFRNIFKGFLNSVKEGNILNPSFPPC